MTAIPTTRIPLVRHVMHIGVPTCPAHMPMLEAVNVLLRENLEALVVLDQHGHSVGLFGRVEAVAAFGFSQPLNRPLGRLTVADVMRPDIPEIPPDIPVTAAVQLMLDQHVRELYLLHHDGGISWPAAVLRLEDALKYLNANREPTE